MQRKKIDLWTAGCVFLLSSVIAGCSGADEQASPSAEQKVESTPQGLDCPNAQGEAASDINNGITMADDGTLSISQASCVCCDNLWAAGRQYCASIGKTLAGGYCYNACGLCGTDQAYSDFHGTCK